MYDNLKNNMSNLATLMWVEKYRPKKIVDIIGQDEVKNRLKGFIETKALPHLLFAGPPGTGKTTAVLALATELFSEELLRSNLLELNASDDRGIETIRNQVKEFAMTVPAGDAPYKIIILDEADALTPAAQQALRRTMERFVKTSRFVLLCNYPGKIIEPIQSRCAYFRFNPISTVQMREKIVEIAKLEKVEFDDEGITTLLDVSKGDMRKAINVLQATAAIGQPLTKKTVYDTIGSIDPDAAISLIKLSQQDFNGARKELLDLLYNKGISGQDILRQINQTLVNDTAIKLSDEKRVSIMKLIAEIDYRLTEGASPDIQITVLLATLAGS
jgi:replication factor C small subunit